MTDLLHRHRTQRGTRWCTLQVGCQALLVVAHLREGETCADPAGGSGIGISTVYRYSREAVGLPAVMAPTLAQAIEIVARKAFVILGGTLLRIDRVGANSGRDSPYCSGEHECHGLNVQVVPTRRPAGTNPPDADQGAARHGSRRRARIIDALDTAGVTAVADTAHRTACPRGECRSGGAASTPIGLSRSRQHRPRLSGATPVAPT